MKINGNDIRPGNVIEHNKQLWIAVKTSHVKPGKGGAFAQVELKNLINGSKLNERFRSSEQIERVRLEQKNYQFLYANSTTATFMDTSNYEQVEIAIDVLAERASLLQDGMVVSIESYNGKALNVVLPSQVTLRVAEAEPAIRGQTAAKTNKPAVLENGLRVMVPVFVNAGDKIVIDTNDLQYIRRMD